MTEKLPRLHTHFEHHRVDFSLITFNWFLIVFVDSVVSDVLFKIWDSFLYEGPKVRGLPSRVGSVPELPKPAARLGGILSSWEGKGQSSWLRDRPLWLAHAPDPAFSNAQVIFRFALALFKYKEEEILKLQDSTSIFKYLRSFTRSVLDAR